MGRLEDKLSDEGRGFLRLLDAVLQVRALRCALSREEFSVRDVKERIEKEKEVGVSEMYSIAAELMLSEYQAIKRVKNLLKEV